MPHKVLKMHGDVLHRNGDYKNAVMKYSEAIVIISDLLDRGGVDHAQSLELKECLLFCYSNRSASHMLDKNFESSLNDGMECIKLNKDSVVGYLRVGECYQRQSQFEEALKVYDDFMKGWGIQQIENSNKITEAFDSCSKKNKLKSKSSAFPHFSEFIATMRNENFDQEKIAVCAIVIMCIVLLLPINGFSNVSNSLNISKKIWSFCGLHLSYILTFSLFGTAYYLPPRLESVLGSTYAKPLFGYDCFPFLLSLYKTIDRLLAVLKILKGRK